MARKPARRVKTRTKAKTAPSSKSKTTAASKKRTTGGRRSSAGSNRGMSGFKKAREKRQKQEEEYERRKAIPFDFKLKPGEEGVEMVILDSEEPFFRSFHKVKNSRGYWEDEVCIADTGETCPLCEDQGKEGSYTMVLSVLDRRQYTTRAGKNVKVSKKLAKVKGRNLPKFERQYKKYKGNLRGLRVLCSRSGDKEAAIGEDLEFLGKVPEAKLKKFKEYAVPADYDEIFDMPSADELRKRHNIGKSKVAGSEEFDNDDDEDYDMDDVDGWD